IIDRNKLFCPCTPTRLRKQRRQGRMGGQTLALDQCSLWVSNLSARDGQAAASFYNHPLSMSIRSPISTCTSDIFQTSSLRRYGQVGRESTGCWIKADSGRKMRLKSANV